MSNKFIKKDFPIFENNKGLMYFDSTATTQKPKYVIEGIKNYLETNYSNIHRGSYDIAIESEKLYNASKQKTAFMIGAESWREIVYTFNATYALNLIVNSLRISKTLKKGDKVLLSIVEHHANIVPWLILKEEIGIGIEYIHIKDDYSLDMDDFRTKLDEKVKIVSMTHVSNVTGQIFPLEQVGNLLKEQKKKPIFIVDGSQSVPHFKVDVKKIGCDFLFFTGHKVMADSGIGVLWGKEELLSELKSPFSGGGAISWVSKEGFQQAGLPDKFEPGTPNLSGAVSLLRAFEYIEDLGGYKELSRMEEELVAYTCKKFKEIREIKLLGSLIPENRVGVFSFVVEGIHSFDIAEYLAENNICIRAGQHCAEPLMKYLGVNNTCRMSLYIYNEFLDIDIFFEVLGEAINTLK